MHAMADVISKFWKLCHSSVSIYGRPRYRNCFDHLFWENYHEIVAVIDKTSLSRFIIPCR